MYGFTMSTPIDRCYRFGPLAITPRDEGAAVYRFDKRRPMRPTYVGCVVRGVLVKPL